MMQAPELHCNCCGCLISGEMGEDCPRCNYPINMSKEKLFLLETIRDLRYVADCGGAQMPVAGLTQLSASAINTLQREAAYGGAQMRIAELIQCYQGRLSRLNEFMATVAQRVQREAALQEKVQEIAVPIPVLPMVQEAPPVEQPTSSVDRPTSLWEEAPPVEQPASLLDRPQPRREPASPVTRRPQPGPDPRIVALKDFFIDSPIMLMVSLGAFLILIFALSISFIHPLFAIPITLGAQVFFAGAAIGTQRFTKFREAARVYAAAFAILIPLLAVNIAGIGPMIDLRILVIFAAVYTALVYGAFAIYQRFSPFGYLGMTALVIADLAFASLLGSLLWAPSMLMLLALPSLASLPCSSNASALTLSWLFAGDREVLRKPVRVYMYIIVCTTAISAAISLLFILSDIVASALSGGLPLEHPIAILSTFLFLLLWVYLRMQRSPLRSGHFMLSYLFLFCVLACVYTFGLGHVGYGLALTGVAFLYHGLNRFSSDMLQPFGKLALHLDQFALVLVSIVPLVLAPGEPLQLFTGAYPPQITLLQAAIAFITIGIIGVGCVLTISVALSRANIPDVAGTPATEYNAWPWLFLLSGVLLNWAYAVVVLMLHADPVQSFLILTLLIVAGAVAVRKRFGERWATPLDVLALSEAILTIGLALTKGGDDIGLLILFALVFYAVLLYQRRQAWLFLPLIFALLALPALKLEVLLLLGVLLPFASLAISRLMAAQPRILIVGGSANEVLSIGWEWPLLTFAVICGIVISAHDILSSASTLQNLRGIQLPAVFASTLQNLRGIQLPAALELVLLSLAWYAAAACARVKWWLVLAVAFALIALLLSWQNLPVLVAVTLLCTTVGVIIRSVRSFSVAGQRNGLFAYALPFYIIAFAAAVLVGLYGMSVDIHNPFYGALLLFYAVVAYGVLLFERQPRWLWLVAGFAIWGILLLEYTNIAYIVVGIGLVAGIVGVLVVRVVQQPAVHVPASMQGLVKFTWRWPWYLTALVAAVVTGIFPFLSPPQLIFPFLSLPVLNLVEYSLFAFAVLFYGIGIAEDEAGIIWVAPIFATWSLVYSTLQGDLFRLITVALLCVTLGVAIRVLRHLQPFFGSGQGNKSFRYALPLYGTAIVATVLTGIDGTFFPQENGAIALLVCAVVAYGVLLFERQPKWLWLVAGFAIWGTLLLEYTNIAYIVVGIGIVAGIAGLLVVRIVQQPAVHVPASMQGLVKFTWGWPWYLTALVAAVVTGIFPSPFFGPDFREYSLFAFAVLIYGIGIAEDGAGIIWVAPIFAIWSLVYSTLQGDLSRLITVVLLCVTLGVAIKVLRHLQPFFGSGQGNKSLRYALPLYGTAIVAAAFIGIDGTFFPQENGAIALLVCAVVAVLIMLKERLPEALVFPAALAVWTILLTRLPLSQQMLAYSFLCVLIFSSQFLWKVVSPIERSWSPFQTPTPARVLSLAGQILVVLVIIALGGPLAHQEEWLRHVGAVALVVLALLVLWFAHAQYMPAVRRGCYYASGLLATLVVSWELATLVPPISFDILTLPPASYLSVVAPFLMRDSMLSRKQPAGARSFSIGDIVSIVGAAGLLLPSLLLSFGSSDNLLSTLLLLGEALSLFALGIAARTRRFILGGAGLIVVGALRALYYAITLPNDRQVAFVWLALVLAGVGLLVGASIWIWRSRRQELIQH